MSAYRPIPKDDYLERRRAGATNIGWDEGVGYYVEDRQALEEFWKASDEIKRHTRLSKLERIDLLCEQEQLYTRDELVAMIRRVCAEPHPRS